MSINYKVENNFYNEADPHQPDTGQLHWKLDMQYKKQWKRKSRFLEPVLWSQSRPFLAGAVKKGAAPAPALQLKLQLWPYV